MTAETPFEEIEHTADRAFRVRGRDPGGHVSRVAAAADARRLGSDGRGRRLISGEKVLKTKQDLRRISETL